MTTTITGIFTETTYTPPSGFDYWGGEPPNDLEDAATATDALTSEIVQTRYFVSPSPDGTYADQFGMGVAVSSDGLVMAVGAIGRAANAGGVHILDLVAGEWVQRGSVLTPADAAANDYFGRSVSLSSDGDILVVGASSWDGAGAADAGGVYVFDWSGSAWVQRGSVIDLGYDLYASSGTGVAISADGLVLAIGSPGKGAGDAGAVDTFTWSGSAWVARGSTLELGSGESFGTSVALSDDGSIMAVGAQVNQRVYIYDLSGSAWVVRGTYLSPTPAEESFGRSVALSADGAQLLVGSWYWDGAANDQGAHYKFEWNGSSWSQVWVKTGEANANDYMGASVAITGDGGLWFVGAPGKSSNEGAVYMYSAPPPMIYGDVAGTTELFSSNQLSSGDLTDAGYGASTAWMTWMSLASESVAATDTATHEVIQWFIESIAASEAISSGSIRNLSYADQVAAADTLVALFNELVAESSSASEAWYIDVASMIVEVSLAVGITTNQLSAVQALAEIITALEVQQTGKLEQILESASGAEGIANLVRATQAVLEQAVAADAQVSYLILLNTISESALADESVSVWQSLNQAIEEGGTAFAHLVVAGEVYTGWVMNTQNGAVSEYQGLNFNSLAKIGTKYYGAASDGIHEIAGTTDSGTDIATYIQTGLMDFGVTHDKAVSDAYLAVDINGRIALGVRVSEKPGPAEFWYEVTMDKDAVSNVKVPIGRGLKGRYWKFEVASEAMSSFDALTVLPSKLTRRV